MAVRNRQEIGKHPFLDVGEVRLDQGPVTLRRTNPATPIERDEHSRGKGLPFVQRRIDRHKRAARPKQTRRRIEETMRFVILEMVEQGHGHDEVEVAPAANKGISGARGEKLAAATVAPARALDVGGIDVHPNIDDA
jgi:hypothetical protein